MSCFVWSVDKVGRLRSRSPSRRRCCTRLWSARADGHIVVGLNQYSHDASVALVDGRTGDLLFAASKERITRRKHDGGETGELVAHALSSVGISEQEIGLVVSNNHHFRVLPFEQRLPFAVSIGSYPPSYLFDPLHAGTPKAELSHHLAHAWSVLPLCPFDNGLIVVMDGMGEHCREFAAGVNDSAYMFDDKLPEHPHFTEVPARMDPAVGYREAESVYMFNNLQLSRVYKRWTPENSPPELYNHGFENMESLGAVYSRISSHIFGDWNSCGKVMGLAPWTVRLDDRDRRKHEIPALTRGSLIDGSLAINFDALSDLPHSNKWQEEEHRPFYVRLANRVQTDVQDQVLKFLTDLRERTGSRNICLVGGVALNSTINGEIVREAGFDNVYIPPYPGDEGISIGCAMFGAHYVLPFASSISPPQVLPPASSFLGREASVDEILACLDDPDVAPYVFSEITDDEGELMTTVAMELLNGGIVGWFQGRSEHGPRALGNRSLLANPTITDMAARLNNEVKRRESFRPFAPSVLADRADEFFELDGLVDNVSPYMSMTAFVRRDVRESIPAVTHVDGTARLQTVREEDNARYFRLIKAFEEVTGIPMVLNTSFNVAGEPIVDSPSDALRTFLSAPIDLLVMGNVVVTKKPQLTWCEGHWVLYRSVEILEIETRVNMLGSRVQMRLTLEDRTVDLTTELELDLINVLWSVEQPLTVAEIAEEVGLLGTDDEVNQALVSLYANRIVHFRDSNDME